MIISEKRESFCQYQGKNVSRTQFNGINVIDLLL